MSDCFVVKYVIQRGRPLAGYSNYRKGLPGSNGMWARSAHSPREAGEASPKGLPEGAKHPSARSAPSPEGASLDGCCPKSLLVPK